MKMRTLAILVAALSVAPVGMVSAQTQQGVPGTISGNPGQTGGADLTINSVIEAIPGDGVALIRGRDGARQVVVMPLPQNLVESERARLDAETAANAERMSALQAEAGSNAAVNAALQAQNIRADRVIAVRRAPNGDLIVYTRG